MQPNILQMVSDDLKSASYNVDAEAGLPSREPYHSFRTSMQSRYQFALANAVHPSIAAPIFEYLVQSNERLASAMDVGPESNGVHGTIETIAAFPLEQFDEKAIATVELRL